MTDWGDVARAALATLLASIPLGISVWALVDVARRPSWAWALAGRRQAAWLAVIMFSVLTVVGGLAVSGWYLLRVRPRIAAAEDGRIATSS